MVYHFSLEFYREMINTILLSNGFLANALVKLLISSVLDC